MPKKHTFYGFSKVRNTLGIIHNMREERERERVMTSDIAFTVLLDI